MAHSRLPLSFATTMARRRSTKVPERDAKIEEAIAALFRGDFPNVNQAARHFGLHFTTLNRRYNGGISIAESRDPQQLFTIPEEHAIVRTITRLMVSGYPVTHSLIREIADEIRHVRNADPALPGTILDS
jgi:helix-turn-helix, Psq domain